MRINFLLFFFLTFTSMSYCKGNTISFSVSSDIHQDKFGKYSLLLPIPASRIDLNASFLIKAREKDLSAKFSIINTWPSITKHEEPSANKYIRLLSIEIDGEEKLPDTLGLFWGEVPSSDKKNSKLADLTFRTVSSNTVVVYPSISWLAESILLHEPINVNARWYIEPQKKYAHYVTNQSLLTKNGYPKNKSSQWLYDRPQAIYQLFIMTGEQEWLAKANELADFYIENIDDNGQFILKKQFDPKMLMPKGLLYRYLISGDFEAKDTLRRMFERSFDWDESYDLRRGFWTERNQAAALNVAVSYWELTGDPIALKRINDIIDATVKMTFSPANGWPLRGCPQHSFKAHEGWGDNSPACSPWMMALLGDALWRFYQLTGDKRAAALIDVFGEFVLNYGIFYGDKRVKNIVIPKYIVSIENTEQEELNQWTNPQHACDVAALLGKSAYIKQVSNQDNFLVKTLFNALLEQCEGSYLKWQREQKKKQANEYWTIKPPRRFGWVYSTTSDLPWLKETLLSDY